MSTIILDIETENTGHDILEHNKRIISVQIGDSTLQELYYADSPIHETSLSRARERIDDLLGKDTTFSGYNLTGFDIPMLEKFLKIRIPQQNLLDLSNSQLVKNFCFQSNRRSLRLEELCTHLNIDSSHKDEMNKKAESYKTRPEIVAQAQAAAKNLVSRRGWSLNFSYGYSIDKIAGGHAIYDSYNYFVISRGSENTLFYRYAVGDIISEYKLLLHTVK